MNVAVLDDDDFICETLKAILQRGGFEVTVFNNAEDAIEGCRTSQFFSMIADYRLQMGTSEAFLVAAVERSRAGFIAEANKIVLLTGAIEENGEGASPIVKGMLARREVELRVKPYSPCKLMGELQKRAAEVGGHRFV